MKTQKVTQTHFIPTSHLKLYDVVNDKGEDLGQVQNFIIDMSSARIAYVLVAFEGFLGLTDKLIPIPFEVLKWKPEKNRFEIDIPRKTMEKSPTISKSEWPDKFLGKLELQDHSIWLESVYRYYNLTPYWIETTTITYMSPEPRESGDRNLFQPPAADKATASVAAKAPAPGAAKAAALEAIKAATDAEEAAKEATAAKAALADACAAAARAEEIANAATKAYEKAAREAENAKEAARKAQDNALAAKSAADDCTAKAQEAARRVETASKKAEETTRAAKSAADEDAAKAEKAAMAAREAALAAAKALEESDVCAQESPTSAMKTRPGGN